MLFLVPYVIWSYHGNQFVREYSRFSEDIVPYVSLHNEILKSFQK